MIITWWQLPKEWAMPFFHFFMIHVQLYMACSPYGHDVMHFLGGLMVYFPNLVGYYFWWLQVEFCWTALSKEVKKWCWRRIWSKQRKTLFPTVARESLDLILSGKFLLTGTSKIFHNILPASASFGIQQVVEPTDGYVEDISQLPNTKYCRVLPSITKY